MIKKQTPLRNRSVAAIGILLLIALILHFYKPKPVPFNETVFSSLNKVADWEGVTDNLAVQPFKMPGVDKEVGRVYSDGVGENIRLYIGYFSVQQQGKKLVGYASNALYQNAVKIPVGTVWVNKTIIHDRQTNAVALFWYDLNGRVLTSRYEAKAWGVWNMLHVRQNNGAIIMVSTPIHHPDQQALLLKREVHFVEALLPLLAEKGSRP